MDAELIERMKRIYQISAWETYGKDAIAVLSEGTPGIYDNNPTINEYKTKGYKLVDANMFGHGVETGEILVFAKMEV